MRKVMKSDDEWRRELGSARFRVLREAATEAPYTGELLDDFAPGEFLCAGCGAVLFDAADKFGSHCGWPSFSAAKSPEVVEERVDSSHSMQRTEVLCAACGSHLGHVFADGPDPAGVRYCINSLALRRKS
jgi:peptide-methionine (R)-S-oxide reductase